MAAEKSSNEPLLFLPTMHAEKNAEISSWEMINEGRTDTVQASDIETMAGHRGEISKYRPEQKTLRGRKKERKLVKRMRKKWARVNGSFLGDTMKHESFSRATGDNGGMRLKFQSQD